MCHRPYDPAHNAKLDAPVSHGVDKACIIDPAFRYIEEKDVCFRGGRKKFHAGYAREPCGERFRVHVIVRQPFHMLIKRIQAASSHDASLSHRASKNMLVTTALGDERGRSCEHGSDPRAETFREVNPKAGGKCR